MKILIVGELASVGFYLAQGFLELGVEVTHIAHAHSIRKDEAQLQFNLTSQSNYKVVRVLHRYFNPLFLDELNGFNFVIYIDLLPFNSTEAINLRVLRKLKRNNGPIFFWSLGCDSKVREWQRKNNFTKCNLCLLYDQKSTVCKCDSKAKYEESFMKEITKIIPGAKEYYNAHRTSEKMTDAIQMPMKSVENISVGIGNEIQFLHGLNRYGFKGTPIIEYVFDRLSKEKANASFVITKMKLNLNDWKSLLSESDVIVDQLFNMSLGMNSLYSLAHGKLLVAGAVDNKIFEIPDPPMVSSEGSIEGLTRSLVHVIDNYDQLKYLKEEAILYIERHHSPLAVAKKFIKVMSNNS